ncbi:MAG: glycosyltransferase family 4 protein [Chloroflexota bacterium]|nr:glycosyltransferase family 4 protein [Chloroflexota bacterium]
MKIAFVGTRGGGLETYVLSAGQWLAQQGHIVHIIYVGSKPSAHEHYPLLRFHSASIPRRFSYAIRTFQTIKGLSSVIAHYARTASLARFVRQLRATEGLDFVEIPEGFTGPSLLRELPFIVRMHGAEWVFRRYCEDGSYNRLLEPLQAQMMRAARQRHSVSHAYATFISGALGIPSHQIDLIRYPIDFGQFPAPESSPLYPIPRHERPFHLMNVGRLERRKGVHTLVAAMPKVWQHEPETTLTFYGKDGNYGRAQIEAAIPPEVHRGRLIFEGFIPRETLVQRYYQAHVYVGPTRFESSGLHLQEGMSAGRPVIGTQMGPLPEFIRHEESGWLVPLDDADTLAATILGALGDADKREAYGQEGRRIAQRMFDLDMIMNQQLALYGRDFKS